MKMKNAVFWDVVVWGVVLVTRKKTAFFVVTAAKTSNLTYS
jgi:hypothetical protein